MLAIGNCDLTDELERIEMPTQLVWGRNDRIIPSSDLRLWSRDIENSESVIYEDTGHVAMFERPARFNADVSGFLARTEHAVRSRSEGVARLDDHISSERIDTSQFASRRLAPREVLSESEREALRAKRAADAADADADADADAES